MTRRHASDLWTPADGTRRDRRRARRQVAELAAGSKSRPSGQEPEQDAFPHPGVGRGGENRPRALRTHTRFSMAPHQATTAVVAKAYPFLAEGGLGSEGPFIGRDIYAGGSFTFDPWVLYERGLLTNPNVLLAGVIGTGKSALAKSLATRSIAFGRRVYVPSDPKGEWTPVCEAVGGAAIVLGPGMAHRLNPLDSGARPAALDDEAWTGSVRSRRRVLLGALAVSVLGRPLLPVEHTALDVALDSVVHAGSSPGRHRTPVLPEISEAMFSPDGDAARAAGETAERLAQDGRDVAHALRRLERGDLAGLFDAPSTVAFDPALPMVSLDLSRLASSGSEASLAIAMTCSSSWMEAAIADPDGGKRWVVYDEAWRIMRHTALLARMQEQWKLSRAWGLANLMVIHRLSDLDAVGDAGSEARALAEGLLADCSVRIMYRQESDQLAATAALLDLTDVERREIGDLRRGSGLWKVRDRSFVVHHQVHPDELDVFDTDTRMTTTSGADHSAAPVAGDAVRCRECGEWTESSTWWCSSCGADRRLLIEDGPRPAWLGPAKGDEAS